MAEIWPVSNQAYHADCSKIGASMLATILESPAKYYKRFVGKDADGKPLMQHDPTPDQILGSATHALILEPENFDEVFCFRPDGIDGRTKDGKEALAKWRLNCIGKTELTPEAMAKARAMAAAALAHPLVAELMRAPGAVRERGILWEEAGLTMKCRPDLYIPGPYSGENIQLEANLNLDFKTSADAGPDKWCSTSEYAPMFLWRYDLQVAAHYTTGIEALTREPCLSGIVVIDKAEPHDVWVYPTSNYRVCGEMRRQKALCILKRCRESGQWIAKGQHDLNPLPNPQPWNFPTED